MSTEFPPRLTPPQQVRREPRPVIVRRGGLGLWLALALLVVTIAVVVAASYQTRLHTAQDTTRAAHALVDDLRKDCQLTEHGSKRRRVRVCAADNPYPPTIHVHVWDIFS